MAVFTLPNGATLSIASAYASPKTVSALTNATAASGGAQASSTGHGYANDDFLEITSGWSKLDQRIVQVSAQAADTFKIGIDTSDTTKYPAAGGTGTVRKINTWQQIVGVLELTAAGGEQQFLTYEVLETDDQYQMPTVRSPQSISFRISDDTTAAHYSVLTAANDDRLKRALKLSLPNGSDIVYNAYITMNPTPSVTKGQIMALTVTASMLALPTRY